MPESKDASKSNVDSAPPGQSPKKVPFERSRVPRSEIHEHIRGRGVISGIALGVSDGLVTNIAFLAGFAGAGAIIATIRLAGTAAMIAGAVSMFFGGVLAGRSERDLYSADARRESHEIEYEPEEERHELMGYYLGKGLTKEEASMVVDRVTSDKQKWLEDILVHELHIHKASLENPYKTGSAVGLSFLLGAFVPLLPYLIVSQITTAIYASIILSLSFLFIVGMWKGRIVGKNRWRSALEMLLVGVVASMLLFGIGHLLLFV